MNQLNKNKWMVQTKCAWIKQACSSCNCTMLQSCSGRKYSCAASQNDSLMSKDILFCKYVWPWFLGPCIPSFHSFLVHSEGGTRGIKARNEYKKRQLKRCAAATDMLEKKVCCEKPWSKKTKQTNLGQKLWLQQFSCFFVFLILILISVSYNIVMINY